MCNCNCDCNKPKLNVGDIIYGYCHGAFGSRYGDKYVVAIGSNWVVVLEYGDPILYRGNPDDLVVFTREPDEDGEYPYEQ